MPIDESHTSMITPRENYKIWRYMDIPSFLSLLIEESLVFTSASLMEDKFEGTFPKTTEQMYNFESIRLDINGSEQRKKFSDVIYSLKDTVYLNCWCKAKTEMIHMWKIYSKEEGIAIETTYNKLKEAITDEEQIFPTEISYLDYNNQQFDWKHNTLSLFTIKREEYESEQELRLILSFPNQIKKLHSNSVSMELQEFYKKFPVIKIKVDLVKLIEKIHISPFAPIWYTDLVRKTLDKFGLGNISVIRSEL